MKILINRESFLDAFSHVQGVVPSRSPRAILQCVLLRADDSGPVLVASDLEVGIRHTVSGVSIDRPGSAVLPTQRIASILRTSADDELSIEMVPEGLIVRGRRAEFKLPGEDPTLFPVPAEFTAGAYHVVKAADLRRLIRRTLPFADIESVRYALGGVLVELTPETMTGVATDGRRLARQAVPCEVVDEPTAPGQPVVPVKACKLIDRNLADLGDDSPALIAWQMSGSAASAIIVRTEHAVISARLLEGRFPAWKGVVPTSREASIHFPEIGLLRSAVDQAAIVTSEESRGCDMTFGGGTLTLKAQAADVGASTVEMPITYEGPEISLTMDPRYVQDCLKTLDANDAITLDLLDAKNPAVFKQADSYLSVVMPLTRDR